MMTENPDGEHASGADTSPFGGFHTGFDFDDALAQADAVAQTPVEEDDPDLAVLWGGSPAKTQTGTGGSTETANSARGDGTGAVSMEEQWGVPARVSRPQRHRSVQPGTFTEVSPPAENPPVEQEGTVSPSPLHFPSKDSPNTEPVGRDGDDDAEKVAEPLSEGAEETLTDNVDDEPEMGGETEENWEEYGDEGEVFEDDETVLPNRQKGNGRRRKKPVRGMQEENLAYYTGVAAILFGWFLLPFVSGMATLWLAGRARYTAKTGRRRSLARIDRARLFGFVSIGLSVVAVILLFTVFTTVLPMLVKAKTSTTVPGDTTSSLEVNPEDVVAGQAVESTGTFLKTMKGKKAVVTASGTAEEALLTGVLPDGTKTFFTYGWFYTGKIYFTGFNGSGPVERFCVSAPYPGGVKSGTPYFVYTDTSGSTEKAATPC